MAVAINNEVILNRLLNYVVGSLNGVATIVCQMIGDLERNLILRISRGKANAGYGHHEFGLTRLF